MASRGILKTAKHPKAEVAGLRKNTVSQHVCSVQVGLHVCACIHQTTTAIANSEVPVPIVHMATRCHRSGAHRREPSGSPAGGSAAGGSSSAAGASEVPLPSVALLSVTVTSVELLSVALPTVVLAAVAVELAAVALALASDSSSPSSSDSSSSSPDAPAASHPKPCRFRNLWMVGAGTAKRKKLPLPTSVRLPRLSAIE
mmetsp:Transcript_172251/g.546884  ORF Transcript_172251/g.546884 Transcript_172251/m.546884 type:complete len:200 (-) Transcript_172251:1049-1648(-)